jgi:dihydrofolate reductase
MRKLIIAEFISLDGVVEAPDQWHFPYVTDDMQAVVWGVQSEAETMLLGRVTYESFAGAFANAPADDPVAAQMNRPAKVVVSKTLHDLEWQNSAVLEGDVVEQVASLKEQSGDAILVTGSTTLARTLLRAGLVDELSLLIHPIVVGSGQRLFDADGPKTPLRLTSCTALSGGVIHAVYHLA